MSGCNAPGVLIAFEGIDGTGKSTQAQRLADLLRDHGHEVVLTREPTDGPYGRRLRALFHDRRSVSPAEELELFLADRRDHVRDCLAPALAAGKVVLTDRYYFSTAAYQGAQGLDPEAILAANEAFAPLPDLALFFDLPPAAAVERIQRYRREIPNDFEQVEPLRRVAAIFAAMERPCICHVNAAADMDTVSAAVEAACRRRLPALFSPA